MQGEIRLVIGPKGYCFIRPDSSDGNTDIFAHASGFEDKFAFEDIAPGDRVSFETAPNPRFPEKLSAKNIRVIN